MSEEYSDEELDKINKRIQNWIREFVDSEFFKALSEEQKYESEFVIESFAEYMYQYFLLPPEKWEVNVLEELCLEILPRKISAKLSYYKAITPVMNKFFEFLANKGILSNSQKLIVKLREIKAQIIKNATNPKNWGMAKTMIMDAMNQGIDVSNAEELNSFINYKMIQHNFNLLQQNRSVLKTKKIGRNDPCPCGSGLKYKKCCLDLDNR